MRGARIPAIVVALGAALAVAALALVRHVGRRHGGGVTTPGGVVMGDVGRYDTLSRILLGRLFGPIAADIAAAAPPGAQVLEVGCGPGHLASRLARDHGLEVVGLDLDPAMIERARVNAERHGTGGPRPTFVAGDVAAMPFADGSFDLVVSTLSMHHWADPTAGLTEIRRVLRPDGRVLVWDIRPGAVPLHRDLPDPVERMRGAPLQVVHDEPWHWPWRLSLAQRIELVATTDDGS